MAAGTSGLARDDDLGNKDGGDQRVSGLGSQLYSLGPVFGADQIGRVRVQPVRARVIPEATESLPLAHVRPDHQVPK